YSFESFGFADSPADTSNLNVLPRVEIICHLRDAPTSEDDIIKQVVQSANREKGGDRTDRGLVRKAT
ncbi:hypothetical protein H0E87_031679, partial [Populus deltoides]